MRESVNFEVHLRRFELWRSAVAAVALAALASLLAWAWLTVAARRGGAVVLALGVAMVVTIATIAAAMSLVRATAGVLSCRDGQWSFAPEAAPSRSGALTVAIDWGSFLLLRIDSGRRAHLWLPVQRRGIEREWHALRCAVYSPPRAVANSATVAALPPQ
jgi:hypothetical protein